MASAADVRERAELRLETIGLMLGDLSEVAQEWEQLSDGERVAWSIDWSNEMAGLERLAGYATAGLLTPEQQNRYRSLLLLVHQVRPVIERCDLYQPVVPVG